MRYTEGSRKMINQTRGKNGLLGESLVFYKLLKFGCSVIYASPYDKYDLVADCNGALKRIQVKARGKSKDKKIYFNATTGVKSRPYDSNDFDVMAFVNLISERALFINVNNMEINKKHFYFYDGDFTKEAEERTLAECFAGLDMLPKIVEKVEWDIRERLK